MTKKTLTAVFLITGLFEILVGGVRATGGTIDAVNKWAWSHNVGWINLNPAYENAMVYADHLEGYAWSETVGWIRLGAYTGGGSHTYANTAANNYGINRAVDGKLSGYAWGTNVGWIKFDTAHSQVTIDPVTGAFDGYAWGENVGWIHLKGGAGGTAYGVVLRRYLCYLPLILKGVLAGSGPYHSFIFD